MLLPLLLIGVVAFFAGKASKASPPAIGALGPGGSAGPHSASSPGQSVRFELGRPYRVVATTELPMRQLQKLITWLALGTYRASAVTVRTRPVPAGSRCIPSHELTVTFTAPKTESVPLGRPVLWDLGDGKVEVILRRVDRLDGAPLSIGASPSRRLQELRAQAKAEMALGKKLGRPLGPIYAEAMRRAMDLQTRGEARPSEIPTFFDGLRTEVGRNWIQSAIRHPGALHRDLDIPLDERIPDELLDTAAHAPGALGRRARLAQTLRSFHR